MSVFINNYINYNKYLLLIINKMSTNIKTVNKKPQKRTNSEAFKTKTKTKDDSTVKTETKTNDLINSLKEKRNQTAKSILDFDFKKKRVQILSQAKEIKESDSDSGGGILYWMFRDCRVQDNWALLFAQKLALKNKLSLNILFCLPHKYLEYNARHYKFLIKGLQEVQEECEELKISFNVCVGEPAIQVVDFIESNHIQGVVCDFLPLKDCMQWQESVLNQIDSNQIPFIRVDAHNIVPCWIASDKLEYAARTIRNKINSQLSQYLQQYPPVIQHKYNNKNNKKIDWNNDILNQLKYDKSDELINKNEITWAEGGTSNGLKMLQSFQQKRIQLFGTKRNDPTISALSNLSPWLHFGHISAQRCVLVIQELKSKYTESVNSYCEEVIIRRELSDNFCYYNINKYNKLDGAPSWAQLTLKQHSKDKRTYLYTLDELKHGRTHDDLWNSAQIELYTTGKLHGFMRMYWAKKVLEWTESPEQALQYALYLNDQYALDGNDPNGYVGCMWSICGVHDQGWSEREIFGKIRFMNYQGCKRKFDIKAYIARWGGKEYNKKQEATIPFKKLKK